MKSKIGAVQPVNSREWWEDYFVNKWDANSGSEQTQHHMGLVLANLAAPEIAYLQSRPLRILDWGCVFGEGVSLLSQSFPNNEVIGLDFVSKAIEEAHRRYPHLQFILTHQGEIPDKFDVIVTSHTLEHFENPLEKVKEHLASCEDLYILLVPYDEYPLPEYHRSQFREESFPQRLRNFVQIYSQVIVDTKYGNQLLVVFGSQAYLHKRPEVAADTGHERHEWDSYYASLPLLEEDEATKQFNAEFAERVSELLPPGSSTLEAGCGGGWQSLALARLGKYNISLMDFSQEALKYAQRLFERENVPGHFVYGDVIDVGKPEYDLVFNAGVLEHYTFDQQVAFLRGMASRSRNYVLALVPNRLCYWYWLWRIQRSGEGEWPFGKETPVVDLSAAFEVSGLHFLGQAFVGETWTEVFINNLAGMDQGLRDEILEVHRSPLIPKDQKCYLVAALGSVSTGVSEISHIWTKPSLAESMHRPEIAAILADTLALRIGAERRLNELQGQLAEKEQAARALTAQVTERVAAVQDLQAQAAEREETIETLRVQVAQREGHIEAFQRQLTEKEAAIWDLQTRLAQREGNIEALQGQLAGKEAAIWDLRFQVAQREGNIEALQEQLAGKEAAVQDLQAQVAQRDENSEVLQGQLTVKEVAIQDLQTQATERGETIEALQVQLAEIEQRTQNLQADLTDKVMKLEAIYASQLWRLGSLYWRMLDLAAYVSPSRLRPVFLRLARRILPRPVKAVLKRIFPLSSPEERLVYQRGSEIVSPEHASKGQYDIICFPIIDWFFRFQRPQQLVSQFARNGHRVFYIDQTALLEGQLLATSASGPKMEWVQENITVVSLVSQSPLNIYADELDDSNLEAMLCSLDVLRQQFNIVTAVCLVQLPFWSPLVARLRREFGWKIVYDCMDDHAGFSTNRAEMLTHEDKLVQDSDLVVVTSQHLRKKMGDRNVQCVVVPNAADFEHFHRAQMPLPLSEDGELQDVKHPIIGYYGAISDWFDMDLIRYAARSRPDWSFVLIGSSYGADDHFDLEKLPNVHFLGEKPYDQLPSYLSHFDVCCIPFKITSLTRATNPVKFYEYLSAGKPVVSVTLPELKPYADYVYFADSADTFVRAIEQALSEDDLDRITARVALARDNTWNARFRQLQTAILPRYPRASIIMVTYDNLELTRHCLSSLYQCTLYPNWELIIVDNGSTDGTQDYLSTLSEYFDHVRVIYNQDNVGFPRATNQGLQTSSGEYFVLLNNDTVVTRGWLTRLLRHFERDPFIGLVGPMTNAIWNEAKLEAHYTTPASLEAFAVQQAEEHVGEHFPVGVLAMFCLAVRRQVIDAIGLLDEQYEIGMFEDDDFALRARLAGWRVVCAQDVFIHHEGRASFRQLGEKRYREIFETNRAKFEQKWDREWQPHRPERRQAILRYSRELRAILEQHPETAHITVFPPTIGWDIHLFQRPHQLALAFAKQGNLIFFCVDEESGDQFSGFQQVADRLYTANVPMEIFQMLEQPLVMTLVYNSHYLTCFCRPVVIYEIIDELEVFPYNQDRLERRHNDLTQSARVVLATSDRLLQRIVAIRPDAILCPNGVDYERFATAQTDSLEPPSDLRPVLDRGRPIIGYCGALARWFDYELIRYAAEARPDLTFLLLGPDHDGTLKQSGIASQPNIIWLGPRPHNIVPHYLRYFEVATIPFKVSNITLSTSPIKLFEYLAAGKPVVTTAMPECRKYEGVLVAESYAEFVAHIDRALDLRNNPAFRARLQKEAQRNTWRARIEQILEAVEARCNGNSSDNEGTVPQLLDESNGQTGPRFTAAAIAHHEPNRRYEMYQTWLDYTLGTNRRGIATLKTVRNFTEIAGKRHLDIGCAYGGTVITFAQAGAESIGIDIDDALLDLARVNLSDYPSICVKLLRRDITVPSDTADLGQLDIITCENVLEHVLNVTATISRIADLLKPNGWLYLTIPNGASDTEILKDGHYGMFGITLLPREDAVAYYTAINFGGNYDVGYFLSYNDYANMLAEHGVQIRLVDDIQVSDKSVAELRKRVLSLRDEFEVQRAKGRIPIAICDRIAAALEDHISKFERRYAAYQAAHGDGRAHLGSRLIRDFSIGLWHIMGHKSTFLMATSSAKRVNRQKWET
ncbi:MAG: methyltransferase domain-containing protein [Chloroflexi bacterium]|nr:methyltransferase domain-containing protein [Chloroflexota bacterium]